ncbi:hypothetical protein BJ508DRAFT_110243 [Ascobolus immersus RN42]|uniref:Uncharacterized protein n=1 Tax=Ascobolus immersus RN42 TaxID=1160509 RepID=A0A3N4IC68_ASCIM|nr:hypothetical protein BJ508DRAFT_110243 [Ascobolus immersus RN42]
MALASPSSEGPPNYFEVPGTSDFPEPPGSSASGSAESEPINVVANFAPPAPSSNPTVLAFAETVKAKATAAGVLNAHNPATVAATIHHGLVIGEPDSPEYRASKEAGINRSKIAAAAAEARKSAT